MCYNFYIITIKNDCDVGVVMYIIGLTGNIASGKSSVARMLGRLGAHVVDCDVVAHYLTEPDTRVWQRVVETFGERILDGDDRINRRVLGRIVFTDPEALRRLEEVVHPAVILETERLLRRIAEGHRSWIASAEANLGGDLADEPVVVLEAIKLIESGIHRRCDALWVVTCTWEQQVQRLVTTRGLSQREAEMRIDAQPPAKEKVRLADVIVENDKTLDLTAQQVWAQWRLIRLRSPK